MLLITFLSMFLSMILIFINSSLSKKSVSDREKLTPFECGFDPKNNSRLPFSLQFFLIAVIFLIFDIEIVLLIPIPLVMLKINIMFWVTTSLMFFLILLWGLYLEWAQGALNWK
uniref:NADH-ubiquinone oxidoreductase chain 3 n=1 Tax=Oncopodura yosiiana TaxID=2581075 RepID=A0A6H0EX81_9HEXA|nr:NADH dehydrogenase subunit 3 [Oncopodura yosiiana]QIT06425.1 NADH dehydrogenase subunit 3 [Oncopodura yosiiana]